MVSTSKHDILSILVVKTLNAVTLLNHPLLKTKRKSVEILSEWEGDYSYFYVKKYPPSGLAIRYFH